MAKAEARLGGIPLAGNSPITWRLQTGTTPYQTTLQVHHTDWARSLQGRLGKPLTLSITDSDGVKQTIRKVYIMHTVPTDSPNRVSFVVADERWKWSRIFVARDFNIPKRTGDRTILHPDVPFGLEEAIDIYDFKAYSLRRGDTKWTAREALQSILQVVSENNWFVESFPIADRGSSSDGEYTLQNIVIRDPGDVAVSKMLSYIPGAEVYVTVLGQVRVIDAADIQASVNAYNELPFNTWEGESRELVQRHGIRPSRVMVHYQREVECLFEFSDIYEGTATPPGKDDLFLQNVIPTVDPETTLEIWQPDKARYEEVKVPAGTWVEVHKWLEAMDKDKPAASHPWTFETIKFHWFGGNLEGALYGELRGGVDEKTNANIMARIQALRQNFRQTFRINPRVMERIRYIQEVRVSPLDPVTGARAPANVWGQAVIIPSDKGRFVAKRSRNDEFGEWILVDDTPASSENVAQIHPSAARVSFIDRDLGIFRVNWLMAPFGTDAAIIPCLTTGDVSGSYAVAQRDLEMQDVISRYLAPGVRGEAKGDGVVLANEMKLFAMMTVIPGAPNNKSQFHVEPIEASDIRDVFRGEFRIQGGTGPDLEVFIPPGEATVRHAWENDKLAKQTVQIMLGLLDPDPTTAGLPKGTRNLSGFKWVNERREIPGHAQAVAAELLAPYADNLMGRVATRLPRSTLKLQGNMSSASIRVSAADSAKVDAVHEFPGQQRPISRFAMMPDVARRFVLGIIDGVIPNE